MRFPPGMLWRHITFITFFASMLIFIAWVVAPSFAVDSNKPLEAFFVLLIPIVWVAIGMGNASHYRWTRYYIEEMNYEGFTFFVLVGLGPLGIINLFRRDDSSGIKK